MLGKHSVSITFDGSGYPSYSFRCEASAESLCHAEYACDCETWWDEVVTDGRPEHEGDGMDPCVGRFVTRCGLQDWFNESDEGDALRGTINIPVTPQWVEGYIFHVKEKR